MRFKEYLDLFENILNGTIATPPYDDPHYIEYTKLNLSRQNRWLKTGKLNVELVNIIRGIKEPMTWILITEPWCGDASHTVPFIGLLSELNDLIDLKIQLRDAEDSEIANYLSNGSMSIPILIVRNSEGKDVFTWGPRTFACQELYTTLKAEQMPFDDLKKALQEWYNRDKGMLLQEELVVLLKKKIN
jgi:hypothetical protein